MNILLRSTFYFSVLLIAVWLLRPLIFWMIGLEFANSELKTQYSLSWRFILPFSICLTITGEFIKGKTPKKIIKSILIRISLAVLSIFVVYLSLFTGMCGWLEKEVYYESKDNKGKIVLMEFGCGATDTDTKPKQEIREITPLNRWLNWSRKVNLTKINTDNWIKK